MTRPSAPAGPGAKRIDASMTLLREVMERPLDPSYAAAAERRRAGVRPRRRTRLGAFLVAAMCGAGTTWAVVELRRPVPDVVAARRTLESEIQRRIDAADQLRASNALLREQITIARQEALITAGDRDMNTELTELARAAGETAVRGPGVAVELVDSPDAATAGDPVEAARGTVLDRDIHVVVNALWAAGAEAVAVNGHRLTSATAIRRAGEAVLVELQPLLPPYRIEAIGDRETLQRRFSAGVGGAYLDVLRTDGISASVTGSSSLDLPAAGGALELTHARPVVESQEVNK